MIATHSLLDFTLPPELEATAPPEARGLARDGVRLLVTADDGERIVHARFPDLPDFLWPGDLIVVNNSGTLPAALPARRSDGSELRLFLNLVRLAQSARAMSQSRVSDDLWQAIEPLLPKPRPKPNL